jgi:hypothetical protein
MVGRNAETGAPNWDWEEMEVVRSQIQGFGVFPKKNANLDWENLNEGKGPSNSPVMLPYIGQECEVDGAFSARLLVSVLRGQFDTVRLFEIPKEEGAEWHLHGLCLEGITAKERQELPVRDFLRLFILPSFPSLCPILEPFP